MLQLVAEFHYQGVRLISIADNVDTDDAATTLPMQLRGVFNELMLADLRQKTLRGQIGQKNRGCFVGEATFGYRSVADGNVRVDKAGQPRPDGYLMRVDPQEQAVVRRIFQAYADGESCSAIVRSLNSDGVPGRFRSAKGWSTGSVTRILDNEKYRGHWVWNRWGGRRDPHTGRRRYFEKPCDEWVVVDDEALRIVPQPLWDLVCQGRKKVGGTWPGGVGRRGFSREQGSRVKCFPEHLLSGAMVCGWCGGSISLVGGKAGGYFGCLAARNAACDNKLHVRRRLAEKIVLDAVRERLQQAEAIATVSNPRPALARRRAARSHHYACFSGDCVRGCRAACPRRDVLRHRRALWCNSQDGEEGAPLVRAAVSAVLRVRTRGSLRSGR